MFFQKQLLGNPFHRPWPEDEIEDGYDEHVNDAYNKNHSFNSTFQDINSLSPFSFHNRFLGVYNKRFGEIKLTEMDNLIDSNIYTSEGGTSGISDDRMEEALKARHTTFNNISGLDEKCMLVHMAMRDVIGIASGNFDFENCQMETNSFIPKKRFVYYIVVVDSGPTTAPRFGHASFLHFVILYKTKIERDGFGEPDDPSWFAGWKFSSPLHFYYRAIAYAFIFHENFEADPFRNIADMTNEFKKSQNGG